MQKLFLSIIIFAIVQASLAQNTIMWKVQDTTNGKVSTLVGTFHQFGNSFVDSIPNLKNNLYSSELVIFETISNVAKTRNNINSRESSLAIEKGFKKKDFQKLLQISKDWKVDVYKLKPFELRWKLQQEYVLKKCGTIKSTDDWDHFDNYLQHLAKENNIEVNGLESEKIQLEHISDEFKNPDWKIESKISSKWIRKIASNRIDQNICALANFYRKFELDYQFGVECQNDFLIQKRNENWLKTLPGLLRKKNCFVAVGYFHLKYKCGLIEQLRKKGFIVTPIEMKR